MINTFIQQEQEMFRDRFISKSAFGVTIGAIDNLKESGEEQVLGFLKESHSRLLEKVREMVSEKAIVGQNGECLPFENSPEIYGNQRINAYKNGYNDCLSKILHSLLTPPDTK